MILFLKSIPQAQEQEVAKHSIFMYNMLHILLGTAKNIVNIY
jgi:hypothetical protein